MANAPLLLLVTMAPPAGRLAEYPCLNRLAQTGLWAKVSAPGPGSAQAIWAAFALGAMQPQDAPAVEPFWQVARAAGKQVVFCRLSSGDPGLLDAGAGWHLVVCLPGDESQSEDWQVIEALASAAGYEAAVMVVGLPAGGAPGLMVAGGGMIAAAGDLETIDLLDLPPTILAWLGVPVPGYMSGRALDSLRRPDEGYTPQELDMLTEHLRGLGYLD